MKNEVFIEQKKQKAVIKANQKAFILEKNLSNADSIFVRNTPHQIIAGVLLSKFTNKNLTVLGFDAYKDEEIKLLYKNSFFLDSFIKTYNLDIEFMPLYLKALFKDNIDNNYFKFLMLLNEEYYKQELQELNVSNFLFDNFSKETIKELLNTFKIITTQEFKNLDLIKFFEDKNININHKKIFSYYKDYKEIISNIPLIVNNQKFLILNYISEFLIEEIFNKTECEAVAIKLDEEFTVYLKKPIQRSRLKCSFKIISPQLLKTDLTGAECIKQHLNSQ